MASSVFSLSTKSKNDKRIVVARTLDGLSIRLGDQTFEYEDVNPSFVKFSQFWDLMETIKTHSYLRAAMSVVGRSAVGTWWHLQPHPVYKGGSSRLKQKKLYEFYTRVNRSWDNIQDFYSIAYNIMIGVMYLRYFGQASYHILRDSSGQAVGLDFLHGLVIPNVDATGKFKSPAFVQFPCHDVKKSVEIANAKDVIYIINPDWEGSVMGGSDIEALSEFTLPIDLYLQTAARDYMKNRDKPEVVYQLPADISDEAFDTFVRELEARQKGASNTGKNPIAVQGEFDIKELRPLPDALPYQESRKESREEVLAVAGVSGGKLGITDSMASANIRELRREFYEASLVPLFTFVEVAFYEQIHRREFGIDSIEFKFKAPDFLNAVEKATVHMRYQQMGALNPNEIRADLGKEPRKDEQGDKYVDEVEEKPEEEPAEEPANPPGSPPEGRENEPDSPANVGEPNGTESDPERGDQHDEEPRDRVLGELKSWKVFYTKRMRANKTIRPFNVQYIPVEVKEIVEGYLKNAETLEEASAIFDDAISEIGGV